MRIFAALLVMCCVATAVPLAASGHDDGGVPSFPSFLTGQVQGQSLYLDEGRVDINWQVSGLVLKRTTVRTVEVGWLATYKAIAGQVHISVQYSKGCDFSKEATFDVVTRPRSNHAPEATLIFNPKLSRWELDTGLFFEKRYTLPSRCLEREVVMPSCLLCSGSFARGKQEYSNRQKAHIGPLKTETLSYRLTGRNLKLVAIASATPAARGGTVTLDGSRSVEGITSYTWKLAPGADCPKGLTLRHATLTRKRVRFRALCSLQATLVVSNGDYDASTTVAVAVRPRPWKTTFSRKAYNGGSGAPTARPSSACAGTTCKIKEFGGINLPACPGTPADDSSILCPLLNGAKTWRGQGYKLATLSDPGGPFDRFAYVASSTLSVMRRELVNPNLLPDGVKERDGNNFYGANKAMGADIDGFLTAIRQHEGLGAPGHPHTGHSQIIKADLAEPWGDPQHAIEALVGPSEHDLQEEVDKQLHEIDARIDKDSTDPLSTIWTGTIWLWDDYVGKWRDFVVSIR